MERRIRDIVRGFQENDLMTYASAISFRVFFAVIPITLAALGVLGTLGLTSVWADEVAPQVEKQTSAAAFQVIDDTVRQVLEDKQLFWITAGTLLAIWEVSGAMRATMSVLSRVYGSEDDRSFGDRMLTSFWIAALVTVLVLATLAAVTVVPRALDGLGGTLLGWLLGIALLFATVGAIVRFAPTHDRPLRWVSFGSVLVILGWIATSLLFRWYVTSVADYDSVFGSLAVVMVMLAYIYLLAIVFLTGLQLDALVRGQTEGPDEEPKPEIIVAKSLASVEH